MDITQIALECISVVFVQNFICHLGRWKLGVDNFSKKSLSYTCTYTQSIVKQEWAPE